MSKQVETVKIENQQTATNEVRPKDYYSLVCWIAQMTLYHEEWCNLKS